MYYKSVLCLLFFMYLTLLPIFNCTILYSRMAGLILLTVEDASSGSFSIRVPMEHTADGCTKRNTSPSGSC